MIIRINTGVVKNTSVVKSITSIAINSTNLERSNTSISSSHNGLVGMSNKIVRSILCLVGSSISVVPDKYYIIIVWPYDHRTLSMHDILLCNPIK